MKTTLKLLRRTAVVAAAGALFVAAGVGPSYAEGMALDVAMEIVENDQESSETAADKARPQVDEVDEGIIKGCVPITITAEDDVALKRIVGNIYTKAGTGLPVASFQQAVSGKSGSLVINPSDLPPGKYTLKYNAQDVAGNISITRNVAIKSECQRPTVALEMVNAECLGTVTAAFDDGNGILDYAVINLYQVDGGGKSILYKTIARQDVINSSTVTLTASLAGLPMGKYLVKAGAFDVAGNNGTETSTSFEVTCSPEPVVVTPEAVTWTQATCAAAGSYTVPVTVGGVYKDSSDQVIAADSYPLSSAELIVTFAPDTRNALASGATASWTIPAEIAATGCASNAGGSGSNNSRSNISGVNTSSGLISGSGVNTGTGGGSTDSSGSTSESVVPTTLGVPGPTSTAVPVGNPIGELPSPDVAPAAQGTGAPSSVLASTGANLLPIALIAGVLIAAGSMFMIIQKRRRQSA